MAEGLEGLILDIKTGNGACYARAQSGERMDHPPKYLEIAPVSRPLTAVASGCIEFIECTATIKDE